VPADLRDFLMSASVWADPRFSSAALAPPLKFGGFHFLAGSPGQMLVCRELLDAKSGFLSFPLQGLGRLFPVEYVPVFP